MIDEVRLDLYFIDWLEIQSSTKRLDLYFIDWLVIWLSAKFNFISSYKQDTLILTDFGLICKINKTRHAVHFL